MKKLLCSFSVAFLFLAIGHARAEQIIKSYPFSFNASQSGESNVFPVTPFDSSLGTLDKVEVHVNSSQLRLATGVFPNNILSNGMIAPYYVELSIHQTLNLMKGEASFNHIFKFNSEGTAGTATDVIDFSLNFTFDHNTDLVGFAPVGFSFEPAQTGFAGIKTSGVNSIPDRPFMHGKTSDFISGYDVKMFKLSLYPNYYIQGGIAGNYTLPGYSLSTYGVILIIYEYTPPSSTGGNISALKNTDIPKSSAANLDNANRLVDLVQTPATASPIIGLWSVTQGNDRKHYIYMYQEGGNLRGMWDDRFIISGSMNGNVFTGKYYTTVNPNGSALTLTVSPDGNNLEGTYHYSIKDYTLSGLKDPEKNAQIIASPTMATPSPGFAGTWGTTAGDIVLKQEDRKISGTWGDKTITGKVNGNVLNGRYYKTSEPELIWDFSMTMKPDGKTCTLFHTRQGGVLINTWRK
jgi:hypothetical protein